MGVTTLVLPELTGALSAIYIIRYKGQMLVWHLPFFAF